MIESNKIDENVQAHTREFDSVNQAVNACPVFSANVSYCVFDLCTICMDTAVL